MVVENTHIFPVNGEFVRKTVVFKFYSRFIVRKDTSQLPLHLSHWIVKVHTSFIKTVLIFFTGIVLW